MQTLLQDQQSRAERNRKHQFYKNMLDQQIKYKNNYHQSSQITSKYSAPPQDRSSNPRLYESPMPRTSTHEPYINSYHKQNSSGQPSTRIGTQQHEEDAEKYLNSCEEIIKNLRQLKEKRKRKELVPLKTESSPRPQPQPQSIHVNYKPQPEYNNQTLINRPEFNYYPKNSYFSGSVWKSKEQIRDQSNQKNKKQLLKPLKTLEERSSRVQLNPQNRRKSIRVTPKNKGFNGNEYNSKRVFIQEGQTGKQMEAQQPQGIKNKYFPKNNSPRKKSKSPKSKSKSKSKSKKKMNKYQDQKVKQQQQFARRQAELARQKQITLQRKQVYECLSQLRTYLKLQNEQIQQTKITAEQINEQIQVSVNQQVQFQQNQRDSKHQKQSKINKLKLLALIKLRKLNQRSKQFMIKMGEGRGGKNNTKHSRTQPQSQLSQLFEKQILKQHTIVQVSKNDKPTITQKSRSKENFKTQNQQFTRNVKDEGHENEQLITAITHQLNRQQQQNGQLVFCLKQLSQYLKNQNQQIQVIKNSRMNINNLPVVDNSGSNSKSMRKSRSQSKNMKDQKQHQQQYRYQEFPKSDPKKNVPLKQQHSKQEENILKQAFLRRLKKARLRGRLLNEKIQTYKRLRSGVPFLPESSNNAQNHNKTISVDSKPAKQQIPIQSLSKVKQQNQKIQAASTSS